MPRTFEYRITWKGPWDGPKWPPRILRLRARNKKHAVQLHDKLFPASSRTVERLKAAKA